MVRRWLEQPLSSCALAPRLCLAYAKTLFMVAPYTTMERWPPMLKWFARRVTCPNACNC